MLVLVALLSYLLGDACLELYICTYFPMYSGERSAQIPIDRNGCDRELVLQFWLHSNSWHCYATKIAAPVPAHIHFYELEFVRYVHQNT